MAGVDEVYAIGGAQAIAAMAYGTETLAPVDVIVGPGNLYVALAKREVAGVVGVPSAFAGPSEIVVVADDTTPPTFAAIDVIVQAEHGPDGLAWLITWSPEAADAIDAEIERLVATAPRRADIEANFARGGHLAIVEGPVQALAVANLIAPEHLQLMTEDPQSLVPLVRNAGAVFCGSLVAGLDRRLRGRAQPRPAHLRLGPVRQRAHGGRLPQAPPRDHRGRGRFRAGGAGGADPGRGRGLRRPRPIHPAPSSRDSPVGAERSRSADETRVGEARPQGGLPTGGQSSAERSRSEDDTRRRREVPQRRTRGPEDQSR